ncbi:MAG: 2-oxoglutarate and iron-dependent oxygenase domain-containing protein, partial [Proteobacteria bacterium]|nr:2-oxoglutarate and iron-dependent oxygenase domain-containing protein [Pseudomonadota bacterium]
MIEATRRLAFEEIPIIDIGTLANKERSDSCIESLRTACVDVGFFYIKNHGFPS